MLIRSTDSVRPFSSYAHANLTISVKLQAAGSTPATLSTSSSNVDMGSYGSIAQGRPISNVVMLALIPGSDSDVGNAATMAVSTGAHAQLTDVGNANATSQ